MEKQEYKTLDVLSKMFNMSQIWLHQLRVSGQVRTKIVHDASGKWSILYNVKDIEYWTDVHGREYNRRQELGSPNGFTKVLYVED